MLGTALGPIAATRRLAIYVGEPVTQEHVVRFMRPSAGYRLPSIICSRQIAERQSYCLPRYVEVKNPGRWPTDIANGTPTCAGTPLFRGPHTRDATDPMLGKRGVKSAPFGPPRLVMILAAALKWSPSS